MKRRTLLKIAASIGLVKLPEAVAETDVLDGLLHDNPDKIFDELSRQEYYDNCVRIMQEDILKVPVCSDGVRRVRVGVLADISELHCLKSSFSKIILENIFNDGGGFVGRTSITTQGFWVRSSKIEINIYRFDASSNGKNAMGTELSLAYTVGIYSMMAVCGTRDVLNHRVGRYPARRQVNYDDWETAVDYSFWTADVLDRGVVSL